MDLFDQTWPPSQLERSPATPEPTGFFIRRIIATGPTVPLAELRFGKGFNLVSGLSQTGKSFAFSLIDYVLGSRNLDEALPPEATGYEHGICEIEAYTGEVFTLRRALLGGPVHWYQVPFDSLRPGTPFTLLPAKDDQRKDDTLSKHLLTLSGLNGLIIRRNPRETRTLSFRDVLHFILIDEVQILTTKSAIMGRDSNTRISDRSTFQALATGEDFRGVVEEKEAEASRRIVLGQVELINSVLSADPFLVPDRATLDILRTREVLDAQIALLNDSLNRIGAYSDVIVDDLERLGSIVRERKSRLLVLDELLSRFQILRDSYLSDLDRLAFSADGSYLLDQLTGANCPVCGNVLSAVDSRRDGGTGAESEFRAACSAEAHKIRVQLQDLEATVTSLAEEREQLVTDIRAEDNRIRQLEAELRAEMHPQQTRLLAELASVTDSRSLVLQQVTIAEQRSSLLTRRQELESELSTLSVRQVRTRGEMHFPVDDLLIEIEKLLEEWNFPGLVDVGFDFRKFDLVVSGKARRGHGKGIRAILYSSIIIGLLRHCRARQLPHPGFVVLDSPLTTYRGPEKPIRDPDDVSENVQASFFRSLASMPRSELSREQVIVFENKEPPEELDGTFNHIRFVGEAEEGRSGFFPAQRY